MLPREAEQLPLPVEDLAPRHGRALEVDARERRRHFGAEEVEHRRLAGLTQPLGALGDGEHAVEVDEEGTARRRPAGDGVEGAGFDEALEGALVDVSRAQPAAEVVQGGEGAVRLGARRQDGLGGALADVLDHRQAEADAGASLP